jgi:hypothetical protein
MLKLPQDSDQPQVHQHLVQGRGVPGICPMPHAMRAIAARLAASSDQSQACAQERRSAGAQERRSAGARRGLVPTFLKSHDPRCAQNNSSSLGAAHVLRLTSPNPCLTIHPFLSTFIHVSVLASARPPAHPFDWVTRTAVHSVQSQSMPPSSPSFDFVGWGVLDLKTQGVRKLFINSSDRICWMKLCQLIQSFIQTKNIRKSSSTARRFDLKTS